MKVLRSLYAFGGHGSAKKFYERIINGKCKDCRAVKLMAEGTPIYNRFFGPSFTASPNMDMKVLDKKMVQDAMLDGLQAEIATEVSKA